MAATDETSTVNFRPDRDHEHDNIPGVAVVPEQVHDVEKSDDRADEAVPPVAPDTKPKRTITGLKVSSARSPQACLVVTLT